MPMAKSVLTSAIVPDLSGSDPDWGPQTPTKTLAGHGDFAMLEWVTSGSGPRLGLLVHHTDAVREFAYDRESIAGKLVRGLDEAKARGWTVVDISKDWARVFAFEASR